MSTFTQTAKWWQGLGIHTRCIPTQQPVRSGCAAAPAGKRALMLADADQMRISVLIDFRRSVLLQHALSAAPALPMSNGLVRREPLTVAGPTRTRSGVDPPCADTSRNRELAESAGWSGPLAPRDDPLPSGSGPALGTHAAALPIRYSRLIHNSSMHHSKCRHPLGRGGPAIGQRAPLSTARNRQRLDGRAPAASRCRQRRCAERTDGAGQAWRVAVHSEGWL